MLKAPRFLQITAEHQDCPLFTVFLTIKSSPQNILITLLQISLKLHENRGQLWYHGLKLAERESKNKIDFIHG